MVSWLLHRLRDTEHGEDLLRGYLWWGLVVRGVLIGALLTLLLTEGNFLAEWLLTLETPFVPQADVEGITALSYVLLFVLLGGGCVARWGLLYRLKASRESGGEASAPEASDNSPGQ